MFQNKRTRVSDRNKMLLNFGGIAPESISSTQTFQAVT